MKTFEGDLGGAGLRFAIVVARFNENVTRLLLQGALDGLRRHGVPEDRVVVAWVPGAFEIPLIAKRLAESGRFDAVICLGAVIRGATPHFDSVVSASVSGTARASLDSGVPVLFGVLTTENIEQAVERAGSKGGNKGFDAAVSAIEMANLLTALQQDQL